jgi:adenosine deaminase
VTVSSDDPIAFESTVTAELALLRLAHGFTWSELGELTVNAARHSFLPSGERLTLAESVAAGWS